MKKVWLIKLMHYEYWPMWAFYLPLLPVILFYGILKRHLFFYTNANPGIDQYGGFFFDSKNNIDKNIPVEYRPISVLTNPFHTVNEIDEFIQKTPFTFPVILKPDSGERGRGVVKIITEIELKKVLEQITIPHLIQEYIAYNLEYGVFVSYLPNEDKYKVISLTEKKFFTVIGNAFNTIEQLIKKSERGCVFFEQIMERTLYDINYIPRLNEICILHTIGNHCNGTEFINRNQWISEELDISMNKVMSNIKGIYYGRFDIKVESYKNLEKLEAIKIIEFNGITAEPTHIYDNTYGYFKSLLSFITTWKYLYRISNYNKLKGVKPAEHVEMIRKFRSRYF